VPITVDEFQELKKTLEESHSRMQQLMKSNVTLSEEVSSLQNMVINSLLFFVDFDVSNLDFL